MRVEKFRHFLHINVDFSLINEEGKSISEIIFRRENDSESNFFLDYVIVCEWWKLIVGWILDVSLSLTRRV